MTKKRLLAWLTVSAPWILFYDNCREVTQKHGKGTVIFAVTVGVAVAILFALLGF